MIGPCFVLVGAALTFGLTALGLLHVIPTQLSTSQYQQTFANLFVVWGVTNVFLRYLFAVLTNPGTPHSSAFKKLVFERESVPPLSNHPLMRWGTCKRTQLDKPPRCHYDSVSANLCLNFDHWCPWLFNSVGYLNYRHFLWLLAWVWVLTLFGALLCVEVELEVFQRRALLYVGELETVLVGVFCFVINLAISLLLGWHLYLAMSAQTSVDYMILQSRRQKEGVAYPNPFDTGSAWRNLSNVAFSQGSENRCKKLLEVFVPPHPRRLPLGKPYPTVPGDLCLPGIRQGISNEVSIKQE